MTRLLNTKRGLRIQVQVLTRAYIANGGTVTICKPGVARG